MVRCWLSKWINSFAQFQYNVNGAYNNEYVAEPCRQNDGKREKTKIKCLVNKSIFSLKQQKKNAINYNY